MNVPKHYLASKYIPKRTDFIPALGIKYAWYNNSIMNALEWKLY